jgi:hypothetical protein
MEPASNKVLAAVTRKIRLTGCEYLAPFSFPMSH